MLRRRKTKVLLNEVLKNIVRVPVTLRSDERRHYEEVYAKSKQFFSNRFGGKVRRADGTDLDDGSNDEQDEQRKMQNNLGLAKITKVRLACCHSALVAADGAAKMVFSEPSSKVKVE